MSMRMNFNSRERREARFVEPSRFDGNLPFELPDASLFQYLCGELKFSFGWFLKPSNIRRILLQIENRTLVLQSPPIPRYPTRHARLAIPILLKPINRVPPQVLPFFLVFRQISSLVQNKLVSLLLSSAAAHDAVHDHMKRVCSRQ